MSWTPPAAYAFKGLVNGLATHARRALATPETEVLKNEWDLVLFGHRGTVDFTGISQAWLRETAKRWAADDLPRRRINPGRTTSGGLAVRHHVGCLARLSQTLRLRPDRGEHPSALGRADMEAFMHRLAYLESAGQITADARLRACREVRHVLTRARAIGLTRPGGPAASLGEDFAIQLGDVPLQPEPGESGRDLPPQIMRQLCALPGPADHPGDAHSGRAGHRHRPAPRGNRHARRSTAWPVTQTERRCWSMTITRRAGRSGGCRSARTTAKVIIAQQQRVRARFPGTPLGELKLLPTDRRNPHGRTAITAFTFAFAHRVWVSQMPVLSTSDGIEFDKRRVFLYAYRHTYAQRHADAGVPIDVLRELMDHRKLDTTRQYYSRRRGTPPRGRRPGRGDAVRPARQPDLAPRPGAAGLRARPPVRRRGRRPVRGLRRAVQRQGRRPAPAPTGSAARAATTSAPTSPTSRTCRPTSMTCCATGNGSSPPPMSRNGRKQRPCHRRMRSPGSGG